jgi:hypothetical protein
MPLASDVRKHARTSGLDPILGGPGFTTTNINPRNDDPIDVAMVESFMRAIKDAYDDPSGAYFHDPDIIPSFYSFHAYASEFAVNGGTGVLDAVAHYGTYVDNVRATIDQVWGPEIGPRIRIACTEWNYAADDDTVNWAAPQVSEFYARFLRMLEERRVWLAIQFLMASNGDGMDMITRNGQPTPAYEAFKAAGVGMLGRSTRAIP